jgi:hypothetical protein
MPIRARVVAEVADIVLGYFDGGAGAAVIDPLEVEGLRQAAIMEPRDLGLHPVSLVLELILHPVKDATPRHEVASRHLAWDLPATSPAVVVRPIHGPAALPAEPLSHTFRDLPCH